MAQCRECCSKAEKNWEFCPSCGSNLRQRSDDLFSEIFERFGRQFGETDKMFERQMEAVDLSSLFSRQPKKFHETGGGFSISIVTSGNKPPKVSVKTFGDVDERKLKQDVYGQLSIQKESREPKRPDDKKPAYEFTEEPKTKVLKTGSKVMVDMELPGVKQGDIEIKELESSVEVKAVAGKKAFFKIITKPEKCRVTAQKFDKGVLRLEFS